MNTSDSTNETETVTGPAKLVRLASLTRQILDEVRGDGLSEPALVRLADLYRACLHELEGVLSDDLREELDRLVAPLVTEATPSEAELRLAEAQLTGWLEGLLQAMQASALSEQAARSDPSEPVPLEPQPHARRP